MAGASLASISAFLNLMYGAGSVDQFRRDVILPNLIPTVFESNATCTWRAKVAARNTAAAKAAGADASGSDFSTDTKLQASLAWAHYESFASITGTAQRIAAANGGYNSGMGGGSELDREIADAGEELSVLLSQHSYSGVVGNTPPELAGLAAAIDSTGTYAGIAQSSYSDWASGENTLASADLSVEKIRTLLFRPVKDATGHKPSVVLCSGTIMDQVKTLADNATAVQIIATPALGPVNVANLGFDGVMVDGVPFLEDRHATASTLYAVNLAHLEYVQIPPDWLSMDPGQIAGAVKEITGKTIGRDVIEGAIRDAIAGRRMMASINALAKNGDSTRIQLVLDAQLRLRRRNAAAKLTLT